MESKNQMGLLFWNYLLVHTEITESKNKYSKDHSVWYDFKWRLKCLYLSVFTSYKWKIKRNRVTPNLGGRQKVKTKCFIRNMATRTAEKKTLILTWNTVWWSFEKIYFFNWLKSKYRNKIRFDHRPWIPRLQRL